MLVEAAWTILRRRTPANAALHDWAAAIAARGEGGGRGAGGKLAGILNAMWRDLTGFAAHAAGPDEARDSAAAA